MAVKPRVLLVEDDHAVTHALMLRLQASGFEVTPAPDGQAAVDVAAHCAPDVLVVDINLPHENGFEVQRSIRDLCGLTPTVMITAMRCEDAREKAEGLPATWFLEKPFTTPFLIQRLRQALESSDEAQP